jgi:hypothetical protein
MVKDRFHLSLVLGSLVLLLMVAAVAAKDCSRLAEFGGENSDEGFEQSVQDVQEGLERVERNLVDQQLRILTARVTLLEHRLESFACSCCFEPESDGGDEDVE